MLEGRCLCGGVQYQIRGEIGAIVHCHCGQCRKASGSSFSTNASVDAADFQVVQGASLIGEFESSPGQRRCFCTSCGSPLFKRMADKPDQLRLRLGTLEGDPGHRPVAHIFASSRAAWTEISDDLPQKG